jgi:hypothetical protein
MAYSASKSGSWKVRPKVGNGPYAEAWVYSYTNKVEHNSSRPWAVEISNVKGKMKLSKVGGGRASEMYLYATLYGAGSSCMCTCDHSLYVSGGVLGNTGEINFTSSRTGFVVDLKKAYGDSIVNVAPHTWVDIDYQWAYYYLGYVAGILINTSSTIYHTLKMPTLVPRVYGGSSGSSSSLSVSGTRYTWRTLKVTGSYSGLTAGNVDYTVQLRLNGSTVTQSGNKSTSGTLTYNWKPNSPGTYTWTLVMSDTGAVLKTQTVTITYPPPEPPTMGNVNNTTYSSINTNRAKTLSANWGVSYSGYPSGTITYEYKCYSTTYGLLDSGTTTSTSRSFTWNMPAQDVRDNIYWTVRAKTSGNSLGYGNTVTSSKVEVYWAYTEPSKISNGSVSPNRFQLFNGNTTISFNALSTINGWGDRPGTRSVEYGLYKNGSVLKWYGRTTTSSTGQFSQNLSYSVPEADVNSTYNVIVHKRLGDTEYIAGSDPRWPTTGTNHITAGNITFYEVIGKISGSFQLDPSIIISGIANKVNYNWTYDKQSSEKVSVYLEVYRISTGKVTKTYQLDQNVSTSQSQNTTKTLLLVDPQEADAYEIRLKATVTELLGNTHTYTLATLTPQVYNPPIGALNIYNVSLPLPTNNATSLLAKQATDITWNYTYSFQGVQITKVTLTVNSNPFGKEIFELPFDATTSPYYNNYTRVSTGDFALGSSVNAYMTIYYQIIGNPTVYSVQTDVFSIKITPTRYVYFLAQAGIGEEQLNKIHPLVNNVDRTSEKIHLD